MSALPIDKQIDCINGRLDGIYDDLQQAPSGELNNALEELRGVVKDLVSTVNDLNNELSRVSNNLSQHLNS